MTEVVKGATAPVPATVEAEFETNSASAVLLPPLELARVNEPEAPVDLVVTRVTSTVRGTATMVGVGPGSVSGVRITTDQSGPPQVVRETDITTNAEGHFVLMVEDLVPGPQTLCLDDGREPQCHRVFVAETTVESPAEIETKILDALVQANEIYDFETALPDWQVLIGGLSTGAGGHFDPSKRTILIHGTSGRTVDEFVVTILHEVGHALEFERLSDDDRKAFLALRGIDPTIRWSPDDLGPDQRWASPAEDFADMFVVLLTNGDHQTRSELASQPSESELDAFAQFVGWID